MGLLNWLTVLFVALKLCGVIYWSWFWVLSPLIFWMILVLFLVVVGACCGGK